MFRAPWGRHVRSTTLFVVALLVAVAALPWILSAGAAGWPGVAASLVPLGILVGGAMSGVRGYAVLPDVIAVRRVGWTTRLARTGLQGVEVAPGVMQGSSRVFGNGGLFALVGRFSNPRLGPYRALVTDPDRTLVLHYDDRRVVISPDRPTEFAQALGVPLLPSTRSAVAGPGNRWGLGWIALIPPVAGIGVALLIYSETRPMEVRFDAERLHVDGGWYEVDLPLTRLQEVELRDSRPPVGKRTNGFAFGSTLRGYFNVEGLGRTRVFIDAGSGPYLLLRSDDGPVILSLQDAGETRKLAKSLRNQQLQR